MGIRIVRTGEGFTGTVTPPFARDTVQIAAPVSEWELDAILAAYGVDDVRERITIIEGAKRRFAGGLNARVSQLWQIEDRLKSGTVNEGDVDVVARALADPGDPIDKIWLTSIIEDIGANPVTLGAVRTIVRSTSDRHALETALNLIGKWEPDELLAVLSERFTWPSHEQQPALYSLVRAAEIAIRRRLGGAEVTRRLLDTMARIAGDASADETLRRVCARTLSYLAGFSDDERWKMVTELDAPLIEAATSRCVHIYAATSSS